MAVADVATPTTPDGAPPFPYRFEIVTLDATFVDPLYQRDLTSLVDEIATDFNPALVGTIILSERSGEKRVAPFGPSGEVYATVDGQTRRAGAIEAGVTELPALVYMELTRQDEASLFSLLQRKRRGMMTHERFKASLVAGEAEAVAINRVLKKHGYSVGPRGGAGSKTIQATAALETVYRRGGDILLGQVVTVLDAAWGGPDADTRDAFAADMIRAIGRVLVQRDQPVDENQLIDRLAVTSPARLRMNAAHLREGSESSGGSAQKWLVMAIYAAYAKRPRK